LGGAEFGGWRVDGGEGGGFEICEVEVDGIEAEAGELFFFGD